MLRSLTRFNAHTPIHTTKHPSTRLSRTTTHSLLPHLISSTTLDSSLHHHHLLTLLDFTTLFTPPPPQCFDQSCQKSKDFLFLFSLIAPVLSFIAIAAVFSRPPPPSENTSTFDDPDTGITFESPVEPARDRKGELAFKAVSYTPWPVEADAEGEPIRIEVGPVGSTQPRTFLFEKVLPQPSRLVVVKLPRPLGIVFEEERRNGRAVLCAVVPGSHADQLMKRSSLDPGLSSMAPQVGDVLRACTATNIVYKTGALMFGAQIPERTIVVFGADYQKWPNVAAALKRGLVSDGDVTLVLERKIDNDSSSSSSSSSNSSIDD